jgi:hypothetical protein
VKILEQASIFRDPQRIAQQRSWSSNDDIKLLVSIINIFHLFTDARQFLGHSLIRDYFLFSNNIQQKCEQTHHYSPVSNRLFLFLFPLFFTLSLCSLLISLSLLHTHTHTYLLLFFC